MTKQAIQRRPVPEQTLQLFESMDLLRNFLEVRETTTWRRLLMLVHTTPHIPHTHTHTVPYVVANIILKIYLFDSFADDWMLGDICASSGDSGHQVNHSAGKAHLQEALTGETQHSSPSVASQAWRRRRHAPKTQTRCRSRHRGNYYHLYNAQKYITLCIHLILHDIMTFYISFFMMCINRVVNTTNILSLLFFLIFLFFPFSFFISFSFFFFLFLYRGPTSLLLRHPEDLVPGQLHLLLEVPLAHTSHQPKSVVCVCVCVGYINIFVSSMFSFVVANKYFVICSKY